MKMIISGLLIVLAFSSYMALTTSISCKLETVPYVTPPAPPVVMGPPPVLPAPAPVEIKPEPQQADINDNEIGIEEEDSNAEAEEADWQGESEETYPTYASNNSIEQEITDVFGAESRIALAVARAESGLNPRAVNRNRNGSKDIGIFQINDRHGWSDEELFDWRKNIRIAKELRDRRGWSEWVVFNNGTYQNFL